MKSDTYYMVPTAIVLHFNLYQQFTFQYTLNLFVRIHS